MHFYGCDANFFEEFNMALRQAQCDNGINCLGLIALSRKRTVT